jgi:RNA polymerase sigma-70 factor (ECF subfamily)
MHANRQVSQDADQELIRRYKESGDMKVLGELYNRYMTLVYGVCLKYLKDREQSRDAVMQIFEKLITLLSQHEVGQFRGWLFVTARNHCLMQLRAAKGIHFEDISDDFMENQAVLHQEEEPSMESNLRKLEDCIAKLGSEQKECVHLFYIEQRCYKEIVQLTGYDDSKVKSYIQNGKRNLKICMEKDG